MANPDYLPNKDGDLVPWTENFIAVANANLPALGLIAGDITALTTKKSHYEFIPLLPLCERVQLLTFLCAFFAVHKYIRQIYGSHNQTLQKVPLGSF